MKRKPKVRILHSGRYAFGCHKSFSKASTQYVKLVKHCYSATTTTINGTAKNREREREEGKVSARKNQSNNQEKYNF